MSVKVPFKVKYGQNIIDIPVNGGKLYSDNAPAGLSNLNGETFTIINQIPQSQTVATKIGWEKHILINCSRRDGLYDKSSGQMVYKSNTWTAYIHGYQNYRMPLWCNDGYYSIDTRDDYFTVNVGDLLIFADIDDTAPKSQQEFVALRDRYKDLGGIITACEVYIRYKPDGTPWNTNHIEVIKA